MFSVPSIRVSSIIAVFTITGCIVVPCLMVTGCTQAFSTRKTSSSAPGAANRDPVLARAYDEIATELAGPFPITPEGQAAARRVGERLTQLRRADPTNGFPIYLLAIATARSGDWTRVQPLLAAGNAAPRLIYPTFPGYHELTYPAIKAIWKMSDAVSQPSLSAHLTDAQIVVLLNDLDHCGTRLVRLCQPRRPLFVRAGGSLRIGAKRGLAASYERTNRPAEAAVARATEAKLKVWSAESLRQLKQFFAAQAGQEEATLLRLGFTPTDARALLAQEDPYKTVTISAESQRKIDALVRETAENDRALAERAAKVMPD